MYRGAANFLGPLSYIHFIRPKHRNVNFFYENDTICITGLLMY